MTDTTNPATAGPADLTPEQVSYLLQGIHPSRVQHLRGMSHLEAWDVRRTLTRVFGFGGWDTETRELVCIREHEAAGGKGSRWTVTYRAQVRLTVKTPDGRTIARWDDGASGSAINQPGHGDAHDLAMKTALSQALKRCAVNLGDQLGLSLYRNGATDPVVLRSLVHETKPTEQAEDPGPGATLPSEEWVKQVAEQLPTATADQVTEIETEARARYQLGNLTQEDAHRLRTMIDTRRSELAGVDDAAA